MRKEKISLPVIGMHCANCATAVEKSLVEKTGGISSAVVNLATEKVFVEYNPSEVTLHEMQNIVNDVGYQLVIDGFIGERHALLRSVISGARKVQSGNPSPADR